jgi:hypothetical protein
MTRALRCGSVMGGLMLGLACGIEQPPAPSTVRTLPTLTPPPQPLPLDEPVATCVFSGALDYPIGGLTTGSQYILYDNGVFGLRYDAFRARIPGHVSTGRRHHQIPVQSGGPGKRDEDPQGGSAGGPLQRNDAAVGLRERRLPAISNRIDQLVAGALMVSFTMIVHDTQQASDGGVAVRWVRALHEWGGVRPFQHPECVNPRRASCSADNVSLEY